MANERDELLRLAKAKQERDVLLDMARAKQTAEMEKSKPQSRVGEAFIEGVGEAGTLGYLPQLQALTAKGIEAISPKPKEELELEKQGFLIKPKEQSYAEMRDLFQKRGEKLAEENPASYGTGAAVGTIASAGALPAVAPSATALGRVGQASLAGGLIGGLQAPKNIEGQVTPFQPIERIKNAATGAVTGGLLQGALVNPAQKLVSGAKQLAELKAFKSSGAMLKDFRKAMGKGKAEELGRFMIDNKMVQPGDTFESVAEKSGILKQKAGEQIGAIYDKIKSGIAKSPQNFEQTLNFLHPDTLIPELKATISDKAIRPKIGSANYDNKMNEILNDISGRTNAERMVEQIIKGKPELARMAASQDPAVQSAFNAMKESLIKKTQHAQLSDPRYLNDLIGEVDSRINWSKRVPELSDLQQGLVALRHKLREKVNTVSDVMGKALKDDKLTSEELKKLNKVYGNALEINKIASDRVARNNANRAFSPSDYGAAATGAVLGGNLGQSIQGAAMGAGLGLVNKGLRQYGNPLLVRGLELFHNSAPTKVISNIKPGTVGAAGAMMQRGRLNAQ